MTSNDSTRSRRVVLVTGSSSGIGLVTAQRLAASGNMVYGASRSKPPAASWTQLTMDVCDEASVDAAIAEILAREGRIDAVVHCAGVSLAGPFEDTTTAEAKHHFDINYFGAFRVVRAVLPAMRRQGGGRIIVVGSIGGLLGLPFVAQYCASKFALDGLIESIRPELKPFGIEATVIHPGDFNTPITDNRIVTEATAPGTPYFEAFQRAAAFYRKVETEARQPDILARRIDRLLRQRRLPVRVVAGNPLEVLGVLAKRSLPSRVFESIRDIAYGP